MLICVKTLSLPYSMKIKFFIVTILTLLLVYCKPKNEVFSTDANIKLRFSADTIWFDTLFTTVKSITIRAKVYNTSRNAVNISQISLSSPQSQFLVYVNGLNINEKPNAELLGDDSLLVLVKVTIDPQDKSVPFLVQDSITFITNGNKQQIKLIAYGQDAVFHRDTKICDETWSNNKPHVVLGMIKVDSGCVLKIDAGTKVYFSDNAGLYVNGQLLAQGSVNNKVELRGYRTEPIYENVANQWSGIVFSPSSKSNLLSWVNISNAETGVSVSTQNDQDTISELQMSHCFIKNMSDAALVLDQADVLVTNSLFTNCANYVVNSRSGGHQTFIHCTFTNYGLDYFRLFPSIVFEQNVQPLNLKFYNNIVWGNSQEEYEITTINKVVSYANNVIRSSNNSLKVGGNKISINRNYMKFKNIFNYDFTPDTLSPAVDSAFAVIGISDSLALNGINRVKPDIGAFERPQK